MKFLIIIGVIVLFLKIVFDFIILKNRKSKSSANKGVTASEPKYSTQGSILTPTEQTFFKCLKQAVPDVGISLKVRLCDVLKPQAKDRKENMSQFGRIKSKHLDFVLYDPKTFQILAAIELDDSSHNQQKRIDRDKFLDQAMKTAEVPLHRFRARKNYDVFAIEDGIGLHPANEEHHDAAYMPKNRTTATRTI